MLTRYETMSLEDIMALPVEQVAAAKSHLYLWVPNALLPDGLAVMKAWGFEYKGNIIWEKVRKDGGPDGRGVGFYFRNVTEILLFGVKGDNFRTLAPARSQVNLIRTQKREHSRKPDEIIPIIESCSPGPFLELFARGNREGWDMWGNQATADYEPTWSTYSNHTVSEETNSFSLTNNVWIARVVDSFLAQNESSATGRKRLVLVHGNRFLLHMILSEMKQYANYLTAFFDAKSLPELVNPLCQKYWELTFSAMEEKYPDAYPAHIFKNIGRLREIKEQICLRDSKSQEE